MAASVKSSFRASCGKALLRHRYRSQISKLNAQRITIRIALYGITNCFGAWRSFFSFFIRSALFHFENDEGALLLRISYFRHLWNKRNAAKGNDPTAFRLLVTQTQITQSDFYETTAMPVRGRPHHTVLCSTDSR